MPSHKRSYTYLFLAFLIIWGCENDSLDSCEIPSVGNFTKVSDMGVISANFINNIRPDFGIPEDNFTALYDVQIFSVEYTTTDNKNNIIYASGAVYLPLTSNDEPLSILSGQHGYTIRKIDVPSVTPLYGYLGLFGASIGYASVQSDYIGLGSSNVSYESVNMHQNGNAIVDLISGIKYYACENDIKLNDKVFLLGYSNGGYNSMAAHKILIDDPRDYAISASVLIAGYYNFNIDTLNVPDTLFMPAWAIHPIYIYDKYYNLELLDKVIKSPYLEKLDNLFKGDLDAITINTYLTTNTRDLFQPEFLNSFATSSVFKEYRQKLIDNSLLNTVPKSPILFIHSKEDNAVDYEQSVDMATNIQVRGGEAEIILLEKGLHSPVAYAPAVIEAINWLKKFE